MLGCASASERKEKLRQTDGDDYYLGRSVYGETSLSNFFYIHSLFLEIGKSSLREGDDILEHVPLYFDELLLVSCTELGKRSCPPRAGVRTAKKSCFCVTKLWGKIFSVEKR